MNDADQEAVDGRTRCSTVLHLCRVDNDAIVAIHPITPGQWGIGRDPNLCEIVVPANFRAVRRAPHAKIVCDDSVVRLHDLGHSNGTFLNDVRMAVGGVELLRPGDSISLAGRRRDAPARCTYVLNERPPELSLAATTDDYVSENGTILALMANPVDTPHLRLDEELRRIDLAILSAKYRDQLDLRQLGAARISDLQLSVLRHAPSIVHFSGHGSSDSAIIMLDDRGNAAPVPPVALSNFFGEFSPPIRCVVLNACFTHQQAEAIAQSVPCVIGMSRAVSDSAAIAFAASFYQGLAHGCSVQRAFNLGCNAIELNQGAPFMAEYEEATPVLLSKAGVADRLYFTADLHRGGHS